MRKWKVGRLRPQWLVIHSSVDSKYFIYFFINLYWSIVVFFKLTFITSILGLVFQRLEYWIDPLTLT